MPDPIELSTNSNSETPAPEHPLASPDIPTFEEHMAEMQNEQGHANPESSIEERQKFIEDPEERKAKIQSILREITPDDLFDEDFDYENYQGDNANDFWQKLDDNFIMQHMDELISCGVKPEDFDGYVNEYLSGVKDIDLVMDNLDTVLEHIGHGIQLDTLKKVCKVDGKIIESKEIDENPIPAIVKAILDEDLEYNFEGDRLIEIMLKNGITANQILSSGTINDDAIRDSEDLLLKNGADPAELARVLEDD